MRVCVTGGTGFIGGALVERLLRDGASVRVLARPSPRADALARRGVEIIQGDLSNSKALDEAVRGTEVVFHAAAVVEGGSREQFEETNVGGTQQAFEACIRQGVPHMVYLSSIAVYGLAQKGARIDELTPLDESPEKRDSYAQSKIAADKYATAIGEKASLAVTILRPGVVYGPGRRLPVALLGFRAGKINVILGTKWLHFPITYIENLIDAVMLAGETGLGLRKYIVIDDDNLTLGQYHATRAEIERTRAAFMPGWPVLAGPIVLNGLTRIVPVHRETAAIWRRQAQRSLQDRWYDTSLIRKQLGWIPRVSLREAVEKTANASK
jgi:nucleoside-diphosphate-sugar epimerase